MPASLANTATQTTTTDSATHTISVVRASGEGLLLGVGTSDNGEVTGAITSVVWDPTGDNQSFTQIGSTLHTATGAERYLSAYYLAAPTSAKTGDVVITWASGTPTNQQVIVRRITGHDTASMIRGHKSATYGTGGSGSTEGASAASFTPSLTIDSDAADLVVDFMFMRNPANDIAANAGQGNVEESDLSGFPPTFGSSTKAGATSVTMGWTDGGFNGGPFDSAYIVISVKGLASSFVPRSMLLGVG